MQGGGRSIQFLANNEPLEIKDVMDGASAHAHEYEAAELEENVRSSLILASPCCLGLDGRQERNS